MNNYEAIVFDFDYTLADSSRGVIECVNFALKQLGLPPASDKKVRRLIGLSLSDTFARLVDERHLSRLNDFAGLFVKRADEIMTEYTVIFDAVPQTVSSLVESGVKLGIVSNKFRYRIEEILQKENLSGPFDVIIGGEDVFRHKPDPEGLQKAAERLHVPPSRMLYVGDSVTDALAAKRAGVPFAAVLTGVTASNDFKGYKVEKFLADLRELAK